MTYNVFGGTLNLAQLNCCSCFSCFCIWFIVLVDRVVIIFGFLVFVGLLLVLIGLVVVFKLFWIIVSPGS